MDFNLSNYNRSIVNHYKKNWGNDFVVERWEKGEMIDLYPQFCILIFPPHAERNMWTYATCAMSDIRVQNDIELHMFSAIKDDSMIELLTVVAHYHKTGKKLDVGHTVNFGRPWQNDSNCMHGYISLPYLDGPDLEIHTDERFGKEVHFYWLIPITDEELEYKKANGLEALEELFDDSEFNYLDSKRSSLVS